MDAFWLSMIAAGLLTFGIRLSFIAAIGRWQPPEWLRRALRYVPIAVFAAIIAPELFVQAGQVQVSLANPRLLAGLLAIFVAWRTKNIVWTLAAGMVALFLLQAFLH